MIAYNCKYTPIEILNTFDECVLVNNSADSFDHSDSRMHPNMCSHVKAIMEDVHKNSYERLFFMNCCTSTLKLYDIISHDLGTPDDNTFLLRDNAAKTPKERWMHIMDLPVEANACAIDKLSHELLELISALEKAYGQSFDVEGFLNSFETEPVTLPDTPFIMLLGARSHPALLEMIRTSFTQPVIDMTCTNNGRVLRPDFLPDDSLEEMMRKYARALMNQTPCMRMSDVSSRRRLLENDNCIGIIYHTIKFCDYYNFEFSALQKEDIPIIKIESDYTSQSAGQLATRLEGFGESLALRYKNNACVNANKDVKDMKKYFAGLDSGSTSTELIIINKDKEIVSAVMVNTGPNADAGAIRALSESGIEIKDIQAVCATGYGRKNISYANDSVTEITCHAKGAKHLFPKASLIIDIGGQDSKVIELDDLGNVKSFVMNDKCAAGTGRFLENMSKVLEISMDDISHIGESFSNDLTISNMCTVFAESEVVSLIAENHKTEDIVHGLNKSVATKTRSLVRGNVDLSNVMMTGGVANNRGVVKELEKQLGTKIFVPEKPEFCGALGAALIALENATAR